LRRLKRKWGAQNLMRSENAIEYFVQAKDAENADAPAESVCENKPETIV
jgi:hypothetical protein